MDSQVFLQQLETHVLPGVEFNHDAHLYAAWAYRRHYPAPEAAVRCSRALCRFAMAQGAATKYNHTLTMALLAILYSRVDGCPDAARDWQAFLDLSEDVRRDAQSVLLEHYSSDRLGQETARRAFISPDRTPLPVSCLSSLI